MPSTTPLIEQLKADYPQIKFQSGNRCQWSADNMTVTYLSATDSEAQAQLLHELGHGLLGHASFERDIQLLRLERAAWDKAEKLAANYDLKIDPDLIECHLDSYRDWLHARSACPSCSSTGLQSARRYYRCAACQTEWQVNDARSCALRRYKTK